MDCSAEDDINAVRIETQALIALEVFCVLRKHLL